MSNKTSDNNVANIEDVKVLKDLMEELKLEKQTALHNNEYGEYITECDVLDLYDKQILALQHILAEQEQDKKKIQELEEENRIYVLEGNKVKLELYIKENYTLKQKVIEALDDIYDYLERLNGPDEDIEYIENKRRELLEDK